ncbi:diaminopimelate epimerase [Hahella sp. CCB-MM4]|uniref:diaminopimelate epimerase n=1 Tax=Hahella sp. (strain CCB-MM4) TaxID=1926491 RepID=UPI000B9C2E34|nr:diaminopimelate epimerase [Hahella sp. CCB-MM4]OZG74807.1 diaminopimelate epimerase [Hahella sp. CCB-MM4]
MLVKFTKMHGLGNDFMVVDLISQHAHFRPDQVRKLADRNFGIGFDQMLLVEPPGTPDVDFRYRIFNADGSEVEQCGNGARCFAKFVRDNRLTNKKSIRVETKNGIIELLANKDGTVTVDMGVPRLEPAQIPINFSERRLLYPFQVGERTYELAAVSMGNPHGVLLVEDINRAPVHKLGRALECHELFPEKANIGFLQVVHRRFAKLRVFERGAGETLACGTGACAAMVAGVLQGLLDEKVEIKLPGGNLKISWEGEGHSVMMTGPATRVFEGQVRI